jgi:hypothetical protein
MRKNVTDPVSSLGTLQKRILVYARQRMLAQEQNFEPEECEDEHLLRAYMAAPKWLAKAIAAAVEKASLHRKRHVNDAGEILGGDPIYCFFTELSLVTKTIEHAARAAGVIEPINPDRLYKLLPQYREGGLGQFEQMLGGFVYDPRPYADDGGRLVFGLGYAIEQEKHLRGVLKKFVADGTAWIARIDDKVGVRNCTVPEMLRDLYQFPVSSRGHIDRQAFNREVVGRERYNRANAALRRACLRLGERGLVVQWKGKDRTRWSRSGGYQRSAIGLTEQGAEIADWLIAEHRRKRKRRAGTQPARRRTRKRK